MLKYLNLFSERVIMKHNHSALLNGLKKGNTQIFKYIFELYYEKLYYYALKFVPSSEIAEEIVQEVLIVIWEKKKELSIHTSLQSYLFTAVKNKSFSYLRTQHFNTEINSENQAHDYCNIFTNRHTEELIEYNELATLISNEINSLPERCRIIFQLSRNSGLSYKQIAAELNISPESVKTQIAIALKRLKLHLARHWETAVY